jgi:transposase
MPRPTLLTPERTEKIVALISAGNFAETAALASGISKQTYYNWLARGKAERERLNEVLNGKPRVKEAPYLEFFDSIEKARAEAEARMVVLITKAAQEPRTWQAAAWWLERVAPQKYGRINRTEISGPEGSPIKSETKNVSLTQADIIAMADEILGINAPIVMENKEDRESANES